MARNLPLLGQELGSCPQSNVEKTCTSLEGKGEDATAAGEKKRAPFPSCWAALSQRNLPIKMIFQSASACKVKFRTAVAALKTHLGLRGILLLENFNF